MINLIIRLGIVVKLGKYRSMMVLVLGLYSNTDYLDVC